MANLGLPLHAADVKGFSPPTSPGVCSSWGCPKGEVKELTGKTSSSNLIAVAAPLDGEIVARSSVGGEAADPTKLLFVVADTGRDATHIGRPAWKTPTGSTQSRESPLQHAGHDSSDVGVVVWISPSLDEKSRTVPFT